MDHWLRESLATPGWEVVVCDDARVLARLARGECDGLLPDCWLDPDDQLHFALELGAVDVLATLPDPRRRTIPAALFGKVLLAGTLQQMGTTVFHRAVLLDQLGVNFYATREGGARTGDGRSFDVEAVGDYLALLTPADYTTHAQTLARWVRTQDGLQGTSWAMDCVDVRLPNGRVPRARHGGRNAAPEGGGALRAHPVGGVPAALAHRHAAGRGRQPRPTAVGGRRHAVGGWRVS